MGGGGEITWVEITHRLEAFITGEGVPLRWSGPSLLGRSSVVHPGFGEGEFQWDGRNSTASIVMPISGPDIGSAKCAKYEK